MSNEELMRRLDDGDESALAELCENNAGLIRSRALRIAKLYNCVRHNENGQQTSYTKETLSDLESVGMLAFIECIRSGKYDPTQGALTTYSVPIIDAAMRRHMETSLGTLSLDPKSMALVRKAQRLREAEGLPIADIAGKLSISEEEAAKHIAYPTHFFSVYDLVDPEDDDDVLDHIGESNPTASPEEIVYRRIQIECLRELFDALPKKERDILGKCYGVFGYRKTPLHEIAMYHMMKEDAVEKAKSRALKKLLNSYPVSKMQLWSTARRLINRW